MTRFVVLEVGNDDLSLIGLTNKPEIAEEIIKSAASACVIDPGELVKIEHEGSTVYTVRRKPVIEPDEFEYVDNDGNPINADGSEVVEGQPTLEEELPYEYESTVWVVRSAEEDKPIGISSSEYYLLSEGLNNPFEYNEATVVSTI